MKKIITTLIALSVIFYSATGAYAAVPAINVPDSNPNKYTVSSEISSGYQTKDLFIGTLGSYIALGGELSDTKTFFQNGEAIGKNDIIISNGIVGISLAVETRNPWGYPAGSVLDAGRILKANSWSDLQTGRDTIWSAEVLVNGWDSWAPDNCGTVSFSLVNYDFDSCKEGGGLKAVKVSRVYNIGKNNFDVVTYYSIPAGKEYAYMYDNLINKGGETGNLSNRIALTNKGDDGGFMFPLVYPKGASNIDAYNSIVGTYGKSYCTTLALPGMVEKVGGKSAGELVGMSRAGGGAGYKEIRVDSTVTGHAIYAEGESRTYNTVIYVDDVPSQQGVLDYLMDQSKDETISVSGTAEPNSTVVVEKLWGSDYRIYGWFSAGSDGAFSFKLPAGSTYQASSEVSGKAQGGKVQIPADGKLGNLSAGIEKVKVTFKITDQKGNPVWAKVSVNDAFPVVRYNGEAVFFAANEKQKGIVEAQIPKGAFTAEIYGEGAGFNSQKVTVTGDTSKSVEYAVKIDEKYSDESGWLSVDLHHHTNKNDAFSKPEDVVKSALAAGLDVVHTSDHDFTTNNYKAYQLTKQYGGEGYIPSEEISASWAHFGVLPQTSASFDYFIDPNSKNNTINQFANLQAIIDETHKQGATITANHPFYSYGLFYAANLDAIPGGYSNNFDQIEFNAANTSEETAKTINQASDLWTAYLDGDGAFGKLVTKKYAITGGSDAHDVLLPGSNLSGAVRTFAYAGDTSGLDQKSVGLAVASAIAKGYSYVSEGPLLDSDKTFGKAYANNGTFEATLNVKSMAGVKDIAVLSNIGEQNYLLGGTTVSGIYKVGSFSKTSDSAMVVSDKGNNEVSYKLSVDTSKAKGQWFAFLVVDENGKYAITNPYWISYQPFSDVAENYWATTYVNTFAKNNFVKGYSNGLFLPKNKVTNAEFCTMFANCVKIDETSQAAITYTDIKESAWYYDTVSKLYGHGYLTDDSTFSPNKAITREAAALIIGKWYASKYDKDISEFKSHESKFADAAGINSEILPYLNLLSEENIISGYPDGKFYPTNTISRAEAVALLFQCYKIAK